MQTERELVHQLPQLRDLQRAWLLLAMGASPRAHNVLRTVPPQAVEPSARAHDAAIWETLELCLGGVATARVAPAQKWQPCLWPSDSAGRMLGGRGYNLLPEFHKLPFADACMRLLATGGGRVPSLRSAAEARELLQAEGWHKCPS